MLELLAVLAEATVIMDCGTLRRRIFIDSKNAALTISP